MKFPSNPGATMTDPESCNPKLNPQNIEPFMIRRAGVLV